MSATDTNKHGPLTYVVEYVWVDGSGLQTRSKTRTVIRDSPVASVADVPLWNYDGSSCKQAPTSASEVTLTPVALFADPFRSSERALMALCSTSDARTGAPSERGSQRHVAERVFAAPSVALQRCWYGLEQEYVLLERTSGRPLGWPASPSEFPAPQGPYYCASNAIGRSVAEEHYQACLRAGIKVSGYNAEVMLGQWEYQIGPCEALDAGDQLIMARYLLDRVCEMHNLVATLDPKPIGGDWNGSGLHTNFSTFAMRHNVDDKAWRAILDGIERLRPLHGEHMALYGEGNDRRLLGSHETSDPKRFSHGVGDRSASIRIGEQIARERCGYIEDRRPASSANPYLVTAALAKAVCMTDDE